MKVRQAVSSDGLLLSSLSMDVQRLHAKHHPEFFKMPNSEDYAVSFFNTLLADIAFRIYIAEEGGEALGYIVCKSMERAENPFSYGMRFLFIDQISVRPKACGRGVGTALMEQAEALAKEMDVPKIQLDSWDFNTGAHAFFEGMGFAKFNHRFWKDL